MKISVFGLGYIGCVTAACFAREGHDVIGVDVNQVKIDIINQGRSPIIEPGVEEIISGSVREGRLRASADVEEAVSQTDISLVCVGTPSSANGSLDLSHIKRVCQQIGTALAAKKRYHVVAIRSTMLPGSIDEIVTPTLEVYSGRRAGRDFGVAINPEFLREGSSLKDFANPSFTLIGTSHNEAADLLSRLYSSIDAPIITIGTREAEMMKYASNCFHALKITFANEIGNVCKQLGVDSHKVMEIFCRDNRLNLSPYYLKPGFAFGGSCLPKDVRALTHRARELDVEVPMLNSILTSNRMQIERAVEMVLGTGRRSVAVLGLSFKSGTDDLRESPMVTLIETLIGKGIRIAIYDRDVELARLFGANKQYIENEIPHISSLMKSSLDEALEGAELIVVGKKEEEYLKVANGLGQGRTVIDLVRLFDVEDSRKNYQGLCW